MSTLSQLSKELDQLHRNLDWPRPKDSEPFDKYTYNTFAQQAARLSRELQALADEAERLRLRALVSAKLCDGEQVQQEVQG